MRYGFYHPNPGTIGGGEKYLMTMMETAIRAKAEVVLLSPIEHDPKDWERLNIHIRKSEFSWQQTNDDSLPGLSRDFDVMTVMHGALPPACHAKRSICHMQFPFESLPFRRKRDFTRPVRALTERRRARQALASYDQFVVNTEFTKRHVVTRLDVPARKITVLPPPVDVPAGKPKAKEPIILSVGRFMTHGHPKKQDLLIEAFRSLRERLGGTGPDAGAGWTLHLVGGADGSPETRRFIARLRELGAGLPVELHVDAPYRDLVDLYRRASIFWHATGAGEDAAKYPERLEHFGITTAEAMMYGLVPVVIGLGGQPEIVDDGRNGYLWQRPEELVTRTAELIHDPKRRAIMSKDAAKSVQRFSKQNFVVGARKILEIR